MSLSEFFVWFEKLLPAFVGFLGAWFGTRWGLTKFKNEKFWEAKTQAYGKIIAAVESIAFWGQHKHSETFCGVTVGDVSADSFHSAMRLISQMEFTASIYFSSKFRNLISEYKDDVMREYASTVEDFQGEDENGVFHGFGDLAGRISNKSYSALDDLNEQAKIDIGKRDNALWRLLIFLKGKYWR
ncbi:TPA: hypothetical protein PXL76_003450 [Yersinia enterocolitica]|nr:hypothetical protein [Yersinia enterocolitica]HDL6891936.1 hypothetical protein [Yersinia enterocolitica]HDL7198060.1 hypothetical protein [Yersinia enterocolitica]HDL7437244.1 hypothetical protein [Yersinia enterocolitica]HDL8307760.1 hypothetical protein [Yersinia enterocolitica]